MPLRVNEIFHSIQGESTHAGRPCVFVRLTYCNLRCRFCDTEYAFFEGTERPVDEIVAEVASYGCRLVEITGGEPLIQSETNELMRRLLAAGHEVLLETSGAWSVEDVPWTGVRIRDVLAPADPLPGAGALSFVSAERPYVDSLTLEQALLPDVMLAWDMDARPLTRPHGAPMRLVVPQMYGYKSVKWVERIVVTREPIVGYWEQRGYDRDAWVGRSNAV